MSPAALDTESRLLPLYNPIREHLGPKDRAWIDNAIEAGCEAEIADAVAWCRGWIAENEALNAEKEA